MGARSLLLLSFSSHLKGEPGPADCLGSAEVARIPALPCVRSHPDAAAEAEGCAVLGHSEGSVGAQGRQKCGWQSRRREEGFDVEVEGGSPGTLPRGGAAGLQTVSYFTLQVLHKAPNMLVWVFYYPQSTSNSALC